MPKLRFLYPVLVLPWAGFDHFRWNMLLLRPTPPSYVFEKKMDLYPCGWAKGYEDGGRLVNQRHYPVMFFDGRRFHKECGVGWVPLSSLETFHPDNTNIVHRRSVAKFLVDGDPRLASSSRAVSGKCIVTPDEHDCNDAEIKSSVRQADPYLGLVGDKPIEDNSDVTNGNSNRDIINLKTSRCSTP